MADKDIKIYKLSYSGTFEEQTPDDPLDLFTLYTILAIYSRKSKRMYIWVSKSASYTLKAYIPQIRELFARKYPDLAVLRNITIESGEEPFDFFKIFSFKKQDLEGHIKAQEDILAPIVDEINELKDEMDSLIKEEKYLEATVISDRIIELSKEIKDKALEKDQKELIENLKEREQLKNLVKDITNEAQAVKELFDKFLENDKYEEAHKLVSDFKKKYSTFNVNLSSIPIIEELFLKDDNAQQAAMASVDKNLQSLIRIESEFSELVSKNEMEGATEALEKAKKLLNKVVDEGIKKKWQSLETQFNSKKKKTEEERIKILNKIDLLESEIKSNLEDDHLGDAIKNCESLLSILPGTEKFGLEKKYVEISKTLRQKLDNYRQAYEKSLIKILILKEENRLEEAIKEISSVMKKLSSSDFIEEKKKLEQLEKSLTSELFELANFNEKINSLELDLMESKNNNFLTQAILACENIIALSKKKENDSLVEKFTLLKEDIELELKETKEIAETLIEELMELQKMGKLDEAISKINSMLEELHGPDFKDQKSQLENMKHELLKEKENQAQFRIELNVLKQKLDKSENKHEFSDSIKICEKIIEISKKSGENALVQNFSERIEDINHEIEETREVADSLLQEVLELKNEDKIKEAISKIVSIEEEIQDACFNDLKNKINDIKKDMELLKQKKTSILHEIEDIEKSIESDRNEHKLEKAMENCKKALQIARDNNEKSCEERFKKILASLQDELENEIKEVESRKYEQLLDQIVLLSNKGINFLDESKFNESLDAFETIIKQLEDFKNDS
ncbi:MAG: hypothetical protein JW891_11555 [Candidatus Lokiarchaeota archaeon]|nr:hypothetical protein [Candidatus Lokiarchaeota archaeon]